MDFKKSMLAVLLFAPYIAMSQTVVGGVEGKGMDMNARPGGIVKEIKLEEPKLLGSTYIDDDWFRGSLVLFSGHKIENYPLRYDIKNHVVEIKIENKDKVKVLQGIRIEQFEWYNHYTAQQEVFINSSLLDASLTSSFMERLTVSEGTIMLVARYKVKLIRGNYVQALDLGERDHRLVKKKEYYFRMGKQLVAVPYKKKKLELLFPDIYVEIKSYMKKENLRLKVESDIIKLTQFIDKD